MINIVYFIILLIGVYFITKKVCNKKASLISIILLSLYPFIFGYSRIFMLDFPLTAVVALSICLLLYTDNFSNRKFSILFGISLGVGMLVKWTFIIFIFGPLCYVLAIVVSKSFKREIKFSSWMVNLFLVMIFAFILSAPWYLWEEGRHLQQILSFWHIAKVVPQEEIKSGGGSFWESKYLWYLVSLINNQVSFVYFVTFLVFIPFFLKRAGVKNRVLMILWIVVPYLFLSNISFKLPRFLLPILPAIAIISGVGISMIKRTMFKKMIIALLFIIGIMQYFLLSYTDILLKKKLALPKPFHYLNTFPTPAVGDIYNGGKVITLTGAPLKKDWKLPELLKIIRRYYENEGRPLMFVAVISEISTFYRKALLRYGNAIYYNRFSSKFKFFNLSPCVAPRVLEEFFKNLESCNVVVFVTQGKNIPNLELIFKELILEAERREELEKFIGKVREEYHLLDRLFLPDNFRAYIYVKKIPCLQRDNWRIFFHNGILSISYAGYNLTQDRGFYLRFFIDGTEFSYENALWDEEIIQDNKLIAQCKWPEKGIIFREEIEITSPYQVEIRGFLYPEKHLETTGFLTGLFLSNYYEGLRTSGGFKRFKLKELRPVGGFTCEVLSKKYFPPKVSIKTENVVADILMAGMVEYKPFIGIESKAGKYEAFKMILQLGISDS
jgi:hypothetical protein